MLPKSSKEAWIEIGQSEGYGRAFFPDERNVCVGEVPEQYVIVRVPASERTSLLVQQIIVGINASSLT
jgi:hypothetical protein